jgi:pilus assembly protein CpaE
MKTAHVLLALQNELLKQELSYLLSEFESSPSVTTADPSDWKTILRQTELERPELMLVELSALQSDIASALRAAKKSSPQTKIIAVHENDDPAVILAALRAGANEFVTPPFEETLLPAVDRVLELTEEERSPERRGKVVGFLSAKGGCGATTLACHIAADLRRKTNKDVLIADLDLTSGMVGFLMKVMSSYSILDAVANLARLDESLWKALKSEWKPGIDVIPSPDDFSHERAPSRDEWRQVLKFMRTQHDWIVLDLGRSMNEVVGTLYGELDELLLVSVLEVSALHGLKTIAQKLRDRGEDLSKLEIVLNRTPKMMDITQEELQKVLGRPLYAMLPNDYPSLYQSYSAGTLLSPENRLAQQFSTLTMKLAGLKEAKPQKKKFSLFA